MKTRWWLISLMVATALLAGCARESASNAPENSTASSTDENEQSIAAANADADVDLDNNQSQANPSQASNPQPAQTSLAASAKSSQSLPVPNLIPPTSSADRAPQSEIGRPDPFATILVPPTVSVKPSSEPAPSTASSGSSVAVAPVPTLPTLPAPQTVPTTQFPPVNLPTLPPPRRLSETIEISGVVEVGGKTSVIVQVPDEHTSRYVHVGDYVGNGAVLVKRVEMGMEPVVILEENGTEITRYVGSGSSLAGLL